MPTLGSRNTSLQCRDAAALTRLDPDDMRALRECGRLRLGKTLYRVAWGAMTHGGCPIAVTSPRGDANEAARVQALLHRRENELSVHGGDYADLRRLGQICELASVGATAKFAELAPLKRILAAGAGELRCGGHRYAVAVHAQGGGVSVSVRRTDLAQHGALRFCQALLDVFRRGSLRPRASTIRTMLQELARAPAMQSRCTGSVARGAGAPASVEPAESPAMARARVAIQQIRREWAAARPMMGLGGSRSDEYPKVDLSRIGPPDLKWAHIDLSGLDLSGTNLKNFNLAGAHLRYTRLRGADLSGAVLANATLIEADLKRANLTGANLVGATLQDTVLNGSKLRHANLSGVDLRRAKISHGTDFSGCCLIGAILSGRNRDLRNVRFVGADLSRANLGGCLLWHAVFTGARLVGASLDRSSPEGACFKGADLLGASMREIKACTGGFLKDVTDGGATDISFNALWLSSADTHEEFLNHRANGTSLQRNIDAIADDALKVRLMRHLLDVLEMSRPRLMDGPDVARGAFLAMLEVLIGNPVYCREDESIARRVAASCETERSRYNVQFLPPSLADAQLCYHMESLLACIRESPDSARAHGVSVMQFVFAARAEGRAPHVEKLAANLERAWRDILPEALIGRLEWAEDVACEPLFPLMGPDTEGGILVSLDYYTNRILGKPLSGEVKDLTWEHLWACRQVPPERGDMPESYSVSQVTDVREALAPFPLLRKVFDRRNDEQNRHRLLETIGLGALTPYFVKAMAASRSGQKLTDPVHHEVLTQCFGPHLAGEWEGAVLTDQHVEALLRTYPALGLANDREAKAFFLLCLSAIMTRLTSSYYFGSEFDSPQALRGYAGALLNHARQSAPDLLRARVWDDWKARLFGLGDAFTCTAILSDMMRSELARIASHDERRRAIREALMPMAWS